jgi:hypothetical protein
MRTETEPSCCFGFEVNGPVELRFLRFGRGEPLEVRTHENGAASPGERLILDWEARPDRPFGARLFRSGRRYRLWISDGGWFVIDPYAPAIEVPAAEEPVRREARLWGVPALLCALHRGVLPLHAAAVEVDGAAVLLAAPRAVGKTTLAAGFARAGFRILSEDVAWLQVGDSFAAVPGPATLRLRPDVAAALEVPGSVPVAEDGDRVHLALVETGRGDCAPVPLKAVLLLRPGEPEIRVRRTIAQTALRDLWPLAFRIPVEPLVRSSFSTIADLVAGAPVFDLSYPCSLETLDATVEAIASRV